MFKSCNEYLDFKEAHTAGVNGYVIYPEGIGITDLDEAKAVAAEQSTLAINDFVSRIEDCATEQVVAEFRDGVEL